jgi:hypothetical protein
MGRNTFGFQGNTRYRRSPVQCGSAEDGWLEDTVGPGWTDAGGTGEVNRINGIRRGDNSIGTSLGMAVHS